MATTNIDPEEKVSPIDQYNQQANDYKQQATDYRNQSTAIDNQMQQLPNFDYNNFYNEWKTGKKPIVDILTSNYKKPEQEITPEQAKKARFGAALTDSLSSIAEIVANGKGSLVRNRGNEPTSTQTTNARLQALKDKYDNEMLNYNAAKGNGEMQDFNQQLQSAMNARGQQRQYLLYKSKEVQDNAKQAQKDANEQQKNAADYQLKLEELGFKGKELDQKMKEFNLNYGINKQKLGIEQYNAKTSRLKADNDIKNNFSGLVINAHPSDPNAQEDATGRKVVPLQMSKQQIQGMANSAKNDAVFMKNHPELLIDKPDMFGTPHKGLTTDQQIAWTYAQDQYNSKFQKPTTQSPSPSAVQWKMPITQNNAGGKVNTGKSTITGNIR